MNNLTPRYKVKNSSNNSSKTFKTINQAINYCEEDSSSYYDDYELIDQITGKILDIDQERLKL